jgi:flagellar basal body-associated protein FliL
MVPEPRIGCRGGFSVVPVLLVLMAVTIAAASGLFIAFAVTGADSAAPAVSAAGIPLEDSSSYAYVPFGTTIANLAEGRLTRYLKITMTLQVAKNHASELEGMMGDGRQAVFKNWLLTYLSDKELADVTGTNAINRMRSEIQDGFNAILAQQSGCKVQNVLFEEFNVQ